MIASNERPIRVAQVVHGLVVGGIETWLVNVLKTIDRNRFQVDFITSRPEACYYDDTVRALGANLIHCPSPRKPWIYGPALRKILKDGQYDAVHAHVDHYGGFIMRVARNAGVKVRIAHSHSDTSRKQSQANLWRQFYLKSTKRWIRTSATQGLAVSDLAGRSLFPTWGNDQRWNTLYCGIDTEAFHQTVNRDAIRKKFGLPEDAIVLGHLGGFREPKNHVFLVEIAKAMRSIDSRAHLLLVGDGPLREDIQQLVDQANLQQHVTFAGLVDDATEVLRGAMDVFVFPSLWEGLPLAVVESQAAGMPSVISDVISSEVTLIPSLVNRLALTDSAQHWAETAITAAKAPPSLPSDEALRQIESSRFNLANAVRTLEALYAGD